MTSLGNTFGLTVIENKNGLRVELEFSNETDILYTPSVPYFKAEFDELDLTSEVSGQVFFVYDSNGVSKSFKDEPLDYLHKA